MRKHGAEAHYVRPDGVYSTSVLQAIPGYQPVSNAYAIASRFTAAPYFATSVRGNSLSGPSLPGLLGFSRPTLLGLGSNCMGQLASRSLRGINGPLTGWEQLKLRWNAYLDRLKTMRAMQAGGAAAQAAVAALTPAVATPDGAVIAAPKPDGDVYAALPNVSSTSPEALNYGQGPAREGMKSVGAAITSGAVQTGDDVTLPLVAKTAYTAGGEISPHAYAQVNDLASMIRPNVPPFVGRQAINAAMARWNGARQWWWD